MFGAFRRPTFPNPRRTIEILFPRRTMPVLRRSTPPRLTRWFGGQHPTLAHITHQMQQSGLRPYLWSKTPNHHYGTRSHGYHKALYVVSGVLEIRLPDANQRLMLRPGDRIDIPAGTRYGVIVGRSGVQCLEAAVEPIAVSKSAIRVAAVG